MSTTPDSSPSEHRLTAKKFSTFSRFGLFAIAFIGDQWTKHWIVNHFAEYQIQPINGFFNLTRLHNEGAAFSFLADAGGWQKYFFIGLGLAVSLFIAVWLWRLPAKGHRLLSFGLPLILAGALGNVYDRIHHGHVIDFLDFFYKTHHWPAFNVADSCLFMGAVLVLLDAFINDPAKQSARSSGAEAD